MASAMTEAIAENIRPIQSIAHPPDRAVPSTIREGGSVRCRPPSMVHPSNGLGIGLLT